MSKSRRQDKRALEATKSISADLEAVRTEERLGGVIAQKENEDLFFIDTVGKDTVVSGNVAAKPVKKTLRIDQILKPESAYTIGRSHKIKGSKSEEALIIKKSKVVGQGKASGKRVAACNATLYDVWADATVGSTSVESLKKSKNHFSMIRAVPVPDAAISYNPSRDEHLAHLESLETQELARLARNEAFKERLPSNECSSDVVASADLVAVANRKLATGHQSDDEDSQESSEIFLGGSTQVNRKKTLQERKRQLRHKELLAGHKSKRQEKNLMAGIDRAPDFLTEIQTLQTTRQEAEQILAPIEEEIYQQRKLNKIKRRLVLEPLLIKLPEELPSSMRQLAPEGNLITDRFRSLIERGVVEATTHKILSTETKSNNRKQGKSVKPRIKMVEKFSYKDFK